MERKRNHGDKWHTLLKEAHEAINAVSPEAKQKLANVADAIADIGEEYQIPPRIMTAIVGAMIGHLSLVEVGGTMHTDEHFDDFIEYGHAAIHVAVASARLKGGWTPGRPD